MSKLRLLILILSGLGMLLSAYLTYTHITLAETSFCLTGGGCDIIKSSSFSRIFRVPVPLFGLIGYLLIGTMTYARFNDGKIYFIYYISLAGLAFSIYLTYIELFVLKAICAFCVGSALIMLSIFICILLTKEIKLTNLKNSVATVLISIFVFGSSYLSHSDALSVKPASQTVTDLAQHLSKTGSFMYGSYSCPHCQTQKLLFGSAFKDINYIECNPDAENSKSSLCIKKGIEGYPTWEINGELYEGAKSLKELARLSEFQPKRIKKNQ
jgi:uncharacterized membrane protein